MAYNSKANESAKKYKGKKQKQIALSYRIDEYELEILPAIKRSGMPVATFIKEAIQEKIAAGATGPLKLEDVLDYVKRTTIKKVPAVMKNDCKQIILYGSCARGDYNENSDVDIAILTSGDRVENRKYDESLNEIATDIGIKTLAVVNFVLLPLTEFEEKKEWYPYFMNIAKEGVCLYERG